MDFPLKKLFNCEITLSIYFVIDWFLQLLLLNYPYITITTDWPTSFILKLKMFCTDFVVFNAASIQRGHKSSSVTYRDFLVFYWCSLMNLGSSYLLIATSKGNFKTLSITQIIKNFNCCKWFLNNLRNQLFDKLLFLSLTKAYSTRDICIYSCSLLFY